jgi:hypothetical protein
MNDYSANFFTATHVGHAAAFALTLRIVLALF